MKRNGTLNSEIAKTLADLGHTDTVAIGDCGLPIPIDVKKIDLALKLGTPSFIDVLTELVAEMVVEKITIATEIHTENAAMFAQIQSIVGCEIEYIEVSHEAFKEQLSITKAVVRTGEATPYANCILHAGVNF